jgi:ferritin-like metal-binding protein YciE
MLKMPFLKRWKKCRMQPPEELKDAFEDHHLQTQKHVKRLEKVFKLIDENLKKRM